MSQDRHAAQLVQALAARLQAELVETHISWVLLAGGHAYKIKKPLQTGFLDYASLPARLHFCEEEVRVNGRLAPGLYLGVVPITGSAEAPTLDGVGPAIEYAVHMRRFPDGALFAQRLAAGRLTPGEVDELADLLARFHVQAPAAPVSTGYGSSTRRRAAAAAALQALCAAVRPGRLDALAAWLALEATRLAPAWDARLAGGHVRECHGDLHLSNVVRLDSGVAAFDAIEFDAALRWIDVIDDAAFTVMDFGACGAPGLGFRFLNRWLDGTGEHEAIALLRHAAVYRSLVRAQVQFMRHPRRRGACQPYLDAAHAWMQPQPRRLTIMHGLPGSGKTFVSQQLLERQRAIRLRSDVERKRLFGLPALASSRAAGHDIYTPEASARTYGRLLSLARLALESGFPVILDAAFLRREERQAARQLAAQCAAQFVIARCEAPPQLLRQRLLARRADASEADEQVLDFMASRMEPLDAGEAACCECFEPARPAGA